MKWLSVLMLALLSGCEGCTDKPMQKQFVLPTYPLSTPTLEHHTYKITVHVIRNTKMNTTDISPTWDLGRVALENGDDDVLHITRTTSVPDTDERGEAIPGTMKDRKVEHVWITIPAGTEIDQPLKVQTLEEAFLTNYEVDNLDGKGRLISTALLKGVIRQHLEGDTSTQYDITIEVHPNRPFKGDTWKLMQEIDAEVEEPSDYPAGLTD